MAFCFISMFTCHSLFCQQVFQWFEGDFTTKAGNASVVDALLPYMPEDVRTYVSENKSSLKVEHFDYDWGLNGPSPGATGKGGKC